MRHMIALWNGLTAWTMYRHGHWSSVWKEIQRYRRWKKKIKDTGPMTLGEQLFEVLREPTDQYIRAHRMTYAGGGATPCNSHPHWVTPQGVNLSMLYRYQIAHTVHYGRGEEHHSPSERAAATTLRVVRKRKTA